MNGPLNLSGKYYMASQPKMFSSWHVSVYSVIMYMVFLPRPGVHDRRERELWDIPFLYCSNLVWNLRNIRDGRNTTRPNLLITEIYGYDIGTSDEDLELAL